MSNSLSHLNDFVSWLDQQENTSRAATAQQTLSRLTIPSGPSLAGGSSVSGQNSVAMGNGAPEASRQGQALDVAIEKGDKKTIVDLLTESTANAVSSILGLSQTRSGWNPLDPNSAQNAQGFQRFVEQILKVPYFNTTQAETKKVHYQESNYNSLIDKVVDLYDGVTEQDKDKIKRSIVNLAKACTSRVNQKNTNTLFVQNSLHAPGNSRDIVVQLAQTFMEMELDHRTGKGAPQDKFRTEIEVNILELTFKGDIWERSAAEKLANKFIESWDDWLNDTTTPPSPHQRNVVFCFSPRQLTSV